LNHSDLPRNDADLLGEFVGNEPPDLSSAPGIRRGDLVLFEFGELETTFRIAVAGSGFAFEICCGKGLGGTVSRGSPDWRVSRTASASSGTNPGRCSAGRPKARNTSFRCSLTTAQRSFASSRGCGSVLCPK
jgi:hypothetical protein